MEKAMIIRLALGVLIGAGLGALMGHYGQCTTGACPLTANPFRGAIYGAFLGVMFAYSMGGSAAARKAAEAAEKAELEGNSPVVFIQNPDAFKTLVLDASTPALVDFYSNSCGPCRLLAPTIHTLAEQYKEKAVVAKVNLNQTGNTALANQYGIRSIPTVIFFDKGKEVERISGYRKEATYSTVLDSLIATTPTPPKKEE
jgi:thioredoxin 1